MSENLLDQGNEETGKVVGFPREKEIPPNGSSESNQPESNRSKIAYRAYRATIVGLVWFPSAVILLPYSTWLLYQVLISKEQLEPRFRRLGVLAAVLNFSIFLFVFLVLVFLFIPVRFPGINPLDFDHPAAMIGNWESEDGALEMEIGRKGRFNYHSKGPPEIEFSGTWGLADHQFLYSIGRITKGSDQISKGKVYAWDYNHFSEKEIVFLEKKEKIRFIRKRMN